MSTRVFVARLAGCAVFDPNGDRVGRIRDVLVVRRNLQAPRVVGFVVEVRGLRRVFMSIGRVTGIAPGQVITTGVINLRRFQQRGEEIRVLGEFIGRRMRLREGGVEVTVEDVAIGQNRIGDWEVTQLFVRRPRSGGAPFAKGPTELAAWSDVIEPDAETGDEQSSEHLVESLAEMPAADAANALLEMPTQQQVDVARQMQNERLADVLEEMREEDQADIIERLGDDRAAEVLDEMEPDDAADLIAHLGTERGEAILELMEPEEAEDVRFLLAYERDTAGGLMTTEPIIVSADTTVAEGLALIRRHELAPAIASAVCVTLPPYEPPTGRFLGVVHFQRMLRYPPHERLGALIDDGVEPLRADASAAEVARALATYNLVSFPVVDDHHRLLGVVTIDDVLDHLLPDDWRSASEPSRTLRRGSHGTP